MRSVRLVYETGYEANFESDRSNYDEHGLVTQKTTLISLWGLFLLRNISYFFRRFIWHEVGRQGVC